MHLLADDLRLPSQHPNRSNGIGTADDNVELVRHYGQCGIELGRKNSVQVGGVLNKGMMTVLMLSKGTTSSWKLE